MSDTDDMIIRINEQASIMLTWANRYRMLKLNAMQHVFQQAAETLMDAEEYMRTLDEQRRLSANGHHIYRTIADDLNSELERIEQRSISYNLVRLFRIIRNFYR